MTAENLSFGPPLPSFLPVCVQAHLPLLNIVAHCCTHQGVKGATGDAAAFNAAFVAGRGVARALCPTCEASHQDITYVRTGSLPAGKLQPTACPAVAPFVQQYPGCVPMCAHDNFTKRTSICLSIVPLRWRT